MTDEGNDGSQRLTAANAETYFRLGNYVYEKEKFSEAAGHFKKAVELDPKHERAWHHLALALACIEEYAEALDAIEHALALDPNMSEAWYIKGLVLEYLDRFEEAVACYNKAIGLKPEKENAKKRRQMLILRHLSKNKHEGVGKKDAPAISSKGDPVVEYYRIVCEQRPNDANLLNSYGSYLAMKGRLEDAEKALTRAVAIDKEFVEAWHNLGLVLLRLDRYSEALRCFSEVLARNPNMERTYFYRGSALVSSGRMEEAIVSFDCALALVKTSEVFVAKGLALMKLGKIEEALKAFDGAIELVPDCEEAWYNKGVAYGNLGNNPEAVACYRRFFQCKGR